MFPHLRPSHLGNLAEHKTVGLWLFHLTTLKVFSWYLLVMLTSRLSVSAIPSQVMRLFFLTVWKAASLSLRLSSLVLMRSSMCFISIYSAQFVEGALNQRAWVLF